MTTEDLISRALLTIAAGATLWVLKEIFQGVLRLRRARLLQDNLVRALYAEIDFNTRDMEAFLEKSPSTIDLSKVIKADPDLVPHITDARHTEIYRNRIRELHTITDRTLRGAVEFYGLLEKIRVQIEGVNLPSYRTLSDEGRVQAVDVIRQTAQRSLDVGRDLLDMFDQDYTGLGLERLSRSTEPKPAAQERTGQAIHDALYGRTS